jgi:ribosomal protein S18 acetylase RimI-like enzyme
VIRPARHLARYGVQPTSKLWSRKISVGCTPQAKKRLSFAARHGFELLNESAIMTLSRADLDRVPPATAAPIEERYFEQFRSLHPRLMPNIYFTAQQILDRLNTDSHLLMAMYEDDLVGYVYFQAGSGVSEGYIDFVSVAEATRRRGIGAQLVSAAAHSAFN